MRVDIKYKDGSSCNLNEIYGMAIKKVSIEGSTVTVHIYKDDGREFYLDYPLTDPLYEDIEMIEIL